MGSGFNDGAIGFTQASSGGLGFIRSCGLGFRVVCLGFVSKTENRLDKKPQPGLHWAHTVVGKGLGVQNRRPE